MNPDISKLELHYFFSDETHSMDAITRNKCERELLYLVNEIASELNFEVKIETEAYNEGGLTEFWTFLGENAIQITIFISALTLAFTMFPRKNRKLEKLQEEYFSLAINEKKLQLHKIKFELRNTISEQLILDTQKFEIIADNNYKILKHRSSFFKFLLNYPKVTQISTKKLNLDNIPIGEPIFIERKDFENYILETDDLEPITDEEAIIEIISPVLKRGKYKWRGIYKDEPIDFYMKDIDFKNEVIQKGVPFKNGTTIKCVLKISRKIDDLGEVKNSPYSVFSVLSLQDNGITIETPKGKKLRNKRNADQNQMQLF